MRVFLARATSWVEAKECCARLVKHHPCDPEVFHKFFRIGVPPTEFMRRLTVAAGSLCFMMLRVRGCSGFRVIITLQGEASDPQV